MQSEGKWVNRFPLETCLGGLVGRSTCVRARDKTPFSRINDLTLPISRRTEFLWATESGGRVLRLLPQVATREERKEGGRGSFNLDSSIEPSHLDETKNKEIPLRSLSLSLSRGMENRVEALFVVRKDDFFFFFRLALDLLSLSVLSSLCIRKNTRFLFSSSALPCKR